MLPPRQRALASAALAVLDPATRAWKAACASWPSSWRTVPGTATGPERC